MARLSIDETIEELREVAEESRSNIVKASNLEPYEMHCNVQCELFAKEQEEFIKWLEELKSYKDAEEQGLLIRLPCKVGDEFWVIAYKSKVITHVKCSGYVIQEDVPNGVEIRYVWLDSVENPRDYWKLDFEDFKTQCFKTKEEAEQALKQIGE